jgi:galactose mutarotase-like enzyme
MYHLKNNKLKISVQANGAELCEISSVKHNTQFMWDAKPDIWGSFAPNLFPIIGGLKNNSYSYDGKLYTLPKHGLIRNSDAITLSQHTENSLTFAFNYNDALLKQYPFKFEFELCFTLTDNKIEVAHRIKNVDRKTLYFSVGGHPAFKCPVFEDEDYKDYSLEFETVENAVTHLLNPDTGLVSQNTKPVLQHSKTLPLTHSLFNDDALIFKDLHSKKISLNSKNRGTILTVDYPDFDYLGIWAKPNGNFVCIEPWLGIADAESTNQLLKEKEGIIQLEAGKTFAASYVIEIHNTLL